MIADNQTNTLYVADCLPVKYPEFYSNFSGILKKHGIDINLLPYTKDVWAVDYMPIQIDKRKFVQFIYNPDYLQSKKWLKTLSDVNLICDTLHYVEYMDRISYTYTTGKPHIPLLSTGTLYYLSF